MRVLVFPTRCGRFFDYEDWGLVRVLQSRIENGELQLFCVDSVDSESFYCNYCRPQDKISRYLQYEGYLLHEVLPLTRKKNPSSPLAAHGCSLGAYHAINIAFRHPHLFQKVLGLSGRYDLTISLGSYHNLFDGFYSQDVYFNNPSHYLPRLSDPHILHNLRKMQITIVIGEEDILLENNHQFHLAMEAKEIPHNYHVWEGEAHRARYWRKMVTLYL